MDGENGKGGEAAPPRYFLTCLQRSLDAGQLGYISGRAVSDMRYAIKFMAEYLRIPALVLQIIRESVRAFAVCVLCGRVASVHCGMALAHAPGCP